MLKLANDLFLTLMKLGFFDMYKDVSRVSLLLVGLSECNFALGVNHQSVTSNVKKDFQKMNDVIMPRALKNEKYM